MRKILFLLLLAIPLRAEAHPHVFVDATGGFRFADGALTGIRIVWQYDAFTTLLLYDQLNLDQDGDGALNDADMAEIVRGETVWEPGYEGDTYLWVNGAKKALSQPKNGAARMVGDAVEVSFDLDLPAPISAKGLGASLKLYDPFYYYAYDIPGAPLMLDAPDGCEAKLIPFVADAQTRELQDQLLQLSQEDIPDDPNVGARFADEVVLRCE